MIASFIDVILLLHWRSMRRISSDHQIKKEKKKGIEFIYFGKRNLMINVSYKFIYHLELECEAL